MKRMHLQLLKKANCVLASLLMLLGFSCTDDEGEGPIICEYGTPYANFQIKGKVVDIDAAVTPSVSGNGAAKTATGAGSTQAADIRFGYCTEFIINAEKPADETTEQELKDYLSTIGDSLVVVADDEALMYFSLSSSNTAILILSFLSLVKLLYINCAQSPAVPYF